MQTILFTGARSGIINKVIDSIIKDNYNIYVTVHTKEELKAVKNKYKQNKNVKCLKLDITNQKDKQQIEKLDIDILVSNAAIGISGSVAEIDINKIRENFEVNVFSNFELIQIALKNMIKKGKGKLIIMSSLAGIIPIPFLGSYCATKASIIKLSESLNLELKLLNKNIKVSLIEPGLYNTGFNRLMLDQKYDQDINTYFKNQINLIRKSENLTLRLFEKKKLKSITKKITKAIKKENPKFVYRAPIFQSIFAKIYSILS